tara:strand:+ start:1347 stop:2057 length:711 start_codon:yes stop_codon:yes gene_type:complete
MPKFILADSTKDTKVNESTLKVSAETGDVLSLSTITVPSHLQEEHFFIKIRNCEGCSRLSTMSDFFVYIPSKEVSTLYELTFEQARTTETSFVVSNIVGRDSLLRSIKLKLTGEGETTLHVKINGVLHQSIPVRSILNNIQFAHVSKNSQEFKLPKLNEGDILDIVIESTLEFDFSMVLGMKEIKSVHYDKQSLAHNLPLKGMRRSNEVYLEFFDKDLQPYKIFCEDDVIFGLLFD